MPKVKIGATEKTNIFPKEKIHTLLESGELGAMIDLKVWDRKSGVISFNRSKKAESYVRQFLDLFYVKAVRRVTGHSYSILDTGNAARDIIDFYMTSDTKGFIFDVSGGAGVVTFGIVVGTDNTAPTISDYALNTLIAHGVGAGQLQYSASTFGAPAADATTSQFTITRNFANGSGGDITVEEIGLYCRALDNALTTRYFCIIRDITGGVVVPNGSTLTVNYRPQTVV